MKRPFLMETKFRLCEFMVEYLGAYGDELPPELYASISGFVKMGLENIIPAKFRFYLSVILRYLIQNNPDMGKTLCDFDVVLSELEDDEPVTEMFSILISLSNTFVFSERFP